MQTSLQHLPEHKQRLLPLWHGQPVGQTTTGVEYRFGFNGKENDKEPKDKFNQQDYGMRVYDPRVGRFLSVDPITQQYPELTPYQFASNRPIEGVDQDGLEFEELKSWGQQAIKTPKLNFSNKESISITATVMGETAHGKLSLDQQVAVGWVYYNRIARDKGVTKGLNGSYAFNRPGKSTLPIVTVMTIMVGLGDDTYKNESSEKVIGTKTIGEFSKTDYAKPMIEKSKELKNALDKAFAKPYLNPYPTFTGQGYWGDLNLEKNTMFKMARAYLWLQRDGKVPNDFANTFVIMLRTQGAEKYTTFIFKEAEIQKYFKEHPEQLKGDVPLYDYRTDSKVETEKNTKMKLLILGTISFLISCKGSSQPISLKENLEDLYVENSHLAIDKDSLFVLEIKNNQDYSLKLMIQSGDTFKLNTYKSLNSAEKNILLKKMSKCKFYIGNLGQHNFVYDAPPAALVKQFDEAESVGHFIKDKENYYVLIQNKKSSSYDLHASKINETDSVVLPLGKNLTQPDFIVWQGESLSSKYLLLFNKTYFMNNNLFEFKIFTITNVPKKRGF